MTIRELWRDGRTKDTAVREAANECLLAWETERAETLEPVSRTGAGTLFRSPGCLVLGRTSRLKSLERNPGLIHWSSISPSQFKKLRRAAKREGKRLVFLLLSHDPAGTRFFDIPGDGVEWRNLPKRSNGSAYFKVFEERGRAFLELAGEPLDVTPYERRVAHAPPPLTPSDGVPRALAAVPYAGIITIDARVRGGKACIRGLRTTVQDVLEYLASGMTVDEILGDFKDLTREDIRACFSYAADRERRLGIQPA
ncbi:MAG TPA: DUF433 domain-containing protein [Phycisphaerales bacterium]|nr:DUF433 domain-containing protein [Phycisphaerales bacterium]